MARIREFNPEEALDKAMHVFWSKGYKHTSMANLVQTTGVGKKGLYTVFGSKKQLYLQALEKYKCLHADILLKKLEEEDSSANEIMNVFNEALSFSQKRTGRNGCMVANAIAEFGDKDPEIKKATDNHIKRFHNAFYKALLNANRNGDIDESLNPGKLSHFLCSVLISIMLMSRAGTEYQIIKNTVDVTLESIR